MKAHDGVWGDAWYQRKIGIKILDFSQVAQHIEELKNVIFKCMMSVHIYFYYRGHE